MTKLKTLKDFEEVECGDYFRGRDNAIDRSRSKDRGMK